MEKISLLFKLAFKFSQKYMVQYLTELKNPLIYFVLGIVLLFTIKISPIFALLAFLSIPLMCFGFWRGFVVTYALIPCAHDFIKEQSKAFSSYVSKIDQGKLGLYVSYVAILTMVLYFPTVFQGYRIFTSFVSSIMLGNMDISGISLSSFMDVLNTLMLNTLFLIPLLNYFLQAYFYKKPNQGYFSIVLECYKKLNFAGIIVMFFVFCIFFILQANTLLFPIALLFCPFAYAVNTFWFLSREKNK